MLTSGLTQAALGVKAAHLALFDYRERRRLAPVGLMILAYGLVVAPVWHMVVEHGEEASDHDHQDEAESQSGDSHSPPPGHSHHEDSPEHLGASAVCHELPTWEPPPSVAIVIRPTAPHPAPTGERPRPRAMPQGP